MGKTDITIQTFESLDLVKYKLQTLGFKQTAFFISDSSYYTSFDKKDIKAKNYNELINHSIIVRTVYEDITSIQKAYLVHKHKFFNKFDNIIDEDTFYTKLTSSTEIMYIFKMAHLFNWVNLQQRKYIFKKDDVTLTISKVNGLDGLFVKLDEFDEIAGLNRNKKFKKLCEYIDDLNITHTNDYSCKKSFMLYKKLKRKWF